MQHDDRRDTSRYNRFQSNRNPHGDDHQGANDDCPVTVLDFRNTPVTCVVMVFSAKHFIETLTVSGVIDPEASEQLRREFNASDSETIARELVQRDVITPYQATAVFAGDGGKLRLGEYVILELIGEGGMGRVFKARHRRLDRLAAIKVLSRDSMHGRDWIERFYQEARTAAQITHPNIVITYDAGEQDGIHYLAMEYVNGKDLGAILEQHGPLPVDQTVDMIRQTACGLEHAHSRNIVHRDIKPANLLRDSEGNIKILDMGLARIVNREHSLASTSAKRLTNPGQVIGTLAYMAPEQAESARQADARSDIYSLGCTLFHLITGEVPFSGESIHQVIMAHREAEIPSLKDYRTEAPLWLDDVFKKCVEKRPCDRFQSASDLLECVEQCQRSEAFGAQPRVENDSSRFPWPTEGTEPQNTIREKERQVGTRAEATGQREGMRVSPDQARYPLAEAAIGSADAGHMLLREPPARPQETRIKRHRGKRLVLLGALGLWASPGFFGLIIGLTAVHLARKDLRMIDAGSMSSKGKTFSLLGIVLGGIAVLTSAIRVIAGFFQA